VAPALDAVPIEVIDKVVVVKASPVRAGRAGDSDDHLAAYFRQLAEHDLLTPEDERELSQGIEETEVLTWERVFARGDVARPLLAVVEPNLETPVSFPKLTKIVDEMAKTKRGHRDSKLVKKLAGAAKDAATQLRTLDLDRVHIDAIVRELFRARQAALAGEITWWADGGTKEAGVYLDGVNQAYRDAMALRDEFVRANLRLVVTMARSRKATSA